MLIFKKDINTLTQEDMQLFLSRMPEEKRTEVLSFRNEDDKKRSVCGFIAATEALAAFLSKDGCEITIAYDKNGKPVCDEAFLSIAHAGDFAVCAVSDRPIGIDAEVFRKVKIGAAFRVCTENELSYIFRDGCEQESVGGCDDETVLRFLEIWTKKEAYGKMLGCGTLYDMKNTEVSDIKTWRDGELIISVSQKDVN